MISPKASPLSKQMWENEESKSTVTTRQIELHHATSTKSPKATPVVPPLANHNSNSLFSPPPDDKHQSPSPRKPTQREENLAADETDSNDSSAELRRSIPGEVKTAKAQINTIEYSNQPPSPRDVLAPDLRMSGGSRSGPMRGLTLGLQEDQVQEDREAARGRTIDMGELADLLA